MLAPAVTGVGYEVRGYRHQAESLVNEVVMALDCCWPERRRRGILLPEDGRHEHDAVAPNARAGSPLNGKIATDKIAVMGSAFALSDRGRTCEAARARANANWDVRSKRLAE